MTAGSQPQPFLYLVVLPELVGIHTVEHLALAVLSDKLGAYRMSTHVSVEQMYLFAGEIILFKEGEYYHRAGVPPCSG